MVKTNFTKTKKIRKISPFFLIFFLQNTWAVLGHFCKNNFLANKKKFHGIHEGFYKKFS